ncbi:MAG: ATP-binding protein [Bacteroidota bacterium]|nr:ATP-binding protein [Bacteroidota bacterium]MDP4196734.1 ATP-binding protein [Bacteroidota bacterium]
MKSKIHLTSIKNKLKTKLTGPLRRIQKGKNEASSELVKLTLEFNKQKLALENEIISKEKAEAELREIKNRLEDLVEKRTFELACVNNKLEKEIQERKNAEAALYCFHKKLTSSFFKNPESINISRLSDGLILDGNESFSRLFGFGVQELIGKSLVGLNLWCNPKDRERLVEQLLSNKAIRNFEADFLTKNKDKKTLSISAEIVEYGEDKAIVFAMRDITEKKITEIELIRYKNQLEDLIAKRTERLDELNNSLSEQIERAEKADNKVTDQIIFFKALLDTIPIPILIQGINKQFTECNSAAEEFLGISKEELLTDSNEYHSENPMTSEEKQESGSSENAKLLADGITQSFESKVIIKNGQIRNVVIYKSLFKRGDDQPGGTITAIFDISERKKIENELVRTLQKEKELGELKTRFVSTASHQFRTPLATIQSSSDLLKMYGRRWPEDKYYEQLNIIEAQIEQMTELLNDVLTISRTESGTTEFAPQNFDFYEACLTAFNYAKSQGKEYHSFVFNYDLDKRQLCLDKKLVKFILDNLLCNAVKYTIEAGQISLYVTMDNSNVIVEVKDQGIGISKEDLSHLFEPFHRGENVCNITGTGLGLSIVRRSVELHGGEIMCKSELKKGTDFVIILPIVDPDRQEK